MTFATTTTNIYEKNLNGIRIYVDSLGGGGAFNLADQAGIMELTAAFAMGTVGDNLTVDYAAGAADTFIEIGRSDL